MSCMFSLLLPHCSQDPPASPAPPAQQSGLQPWCLNMLYCPSHFSADFSMMSCQTGLWQTHTSYLPRKDQPKSCYICITFLCKLGCVQKVKMTGPIPWSALQLPSPSKALVIPPRLCSSLWCDICSRQRGSVRKFPSPKSHGRIHPGLSPQWGEQCTFI